MKKKRNAWQWIVRVICGYELAVACLVLLLVIVFFSTLEQAETGLYAVKKKYYDVHVFFVQPELRGKLQPIILPGAYWVCALFTVNLIAGGLLRLTAVLWSQRSSRTWPQRVCKTIGVLVSHMSMAVLMIAGAVDYHTSSTTMLSVVEGETNDLGEMEDDIVIEVSEINQGVSSNIHVIANNEIGHMILNGKKSFFSRSQAKKTFKFEGFPFSLEFPGWYRNADVFEAKKSRQEGDGEVVNGVFLRPDKILTHEEMARIANFNQGQPQGKNVKANNHSACYAVVRDDAGREIPVVMWASLNHPVTVTIEGKTYGFKITSRKTLLPFKVSLRELDVEKYQGTLQARDYKSHVTFDADSSTRDATISMNKPLRDSGYTVYQARWSRAADEKAREKQIKQMKKDGEPLSFKQGEKRESVYQVVSNPADKWPEYCVYVCGVGLLLHFLIKLSGFVWNSFDRKEKHEG